MDTIHIFDEFKNREIYGSNPTILHEKRVKLEPLVFDILKIRYYSIYDEYWKNNSIPYNSDKSIILVERRIHENLAFILRNIFYYTRDWAITIICSDINYEYIKTILTNNVANVHIRPLLKGNPERDEARKEYNNLLMNSDFYEELPFEHLFFMEMDTYFRRSIDTSIFHYDFVGGFYAWDKSSCGGGMNYRKRSVMIDICEKYKSDTPMQDCYALEGIKTLNYKIPTFEDGLNFINESCYGINPFGLHQWWSFYTIQADPLQLYLKMFFDCEIIT